MKSTQNFSLNAFNRSLSFVIGLLFCISILFSTSVQAHHPWEGQMEGFTFFQGIVSGLTHPVLGLDHCLFLLSIGLVSRFSLAKWLPLLLLSGLGGSVLSQVLPPIPGAEFFMGLSLIASALVAMDLLSPSVVIPLIISHGFVLGNVLIGAELTPLGAYFIGLLISEAAVITIGFSLFKRYWEQRRLFIGILIGAGITLSYGMLF